MDLENLDLEKKIKGLRCELDKKFAADFAAKLASQINDESCKKLSLVRQKAPLGFAKKVAWLISQQAKQRREGWAGLGLLAGGLALAALALLPHLNTIAGAGQAIVASLTLTTVIIYLVALTSLGISAITKSKPLAFAGQGLAVLSIFLTFQPFWGTSEVKNNTTALRFGGDLVITGQVERAINIGGSITVQTGAKAKETLAIGGNIKMFGQGNAASLVGRVENKGTLQASNNLLQPEQWPLYLLALSAILIGVFDRLGWRFRLVWPQALAITGLIWLVTLPLALGIGYELTGNSLILLSSIGLLLIFLFGLGLSAKKLGYLITNRFQLNTNSSVQTTLGFTILLICLAIPGLALFVWPAASLAGLALENSE